MMADHIWTGMQCWDSPKCAALDPEDAEMTASRALAVQRI